MVARTPLPNYSRTPCPNATARASGEAEGRRQQGCAASCGIAGAAFYRVSAAGRLRNLGFHPLRCNDAWQAVERRTGRRTRALSSFLAPGGLGILSLAFKRNSTCRLPDRRATPPPPATLYRRMLLPPCPPRRPPCVAARPRSP